MHACAVAPAIALGVVLVVLAPAALSRLAAAVYGSGLVICLGISALYHRGRWSYRVKAAFARADHATIFLLIAGTATPVFLLSVGGTLGAVLAVVEWVGAACGIAVALGVRHPPVWAEVGPYLALGWLGLVALPALAVSGGVAAVALLLGGGVLYSVGAVCYARELPDPWPTTFGFHELFHSFVIAAVSAHAVLVAVLVISA
jgi:hemolysin III